VERIVGSTNSSRYLTLEGHQVNGELLIHLQVDCGDFESMYGIFYIGYWNYGDERDNEICMKCVIGDILWSFYN